MGVKANSVLRTKQIDISRVVWHLKTNVTVNLSGLALMNVSILVLQVEWIQI